jgi:hypothetical protein
MITRRRAANQNTTSVASSARTRSRSPPPRGGGRGGGGRDGGGRGGRGGGGRGGGVRARQEIREEAEEEEEAEAEEEVPQASGSRGRKKKMTDNEKIQQARDNNEEEYTSYMTQGNSWKLLTLQENKEAEDTYKDWSISLDGFSLPTQIANYLDKVSRHQLFFDKNFQNAWANKIYMLHLPEDHDWAVENNFQELRITDIQDGKYLAQNDDATGAKIAQKTEKGYLNNVLNLKTYKNYVSDNNDVPPDNLNWLIEKEKDLIKDLMEQSMARTDRKPLGLTLTTFNGYIKSIRRYLKLMLGPNHELRIKYSVLYGMIDRGIQYMKGGNEAGGDDIMYFGDLIDITGWLYQQWVGRYGITTGKRTKNVTYNLLPQGAPELFPADGPEIIVASKDRLKDQAWKACLNFLSVAVMVYDYPSRADKYSTIIIDDEKYATGKETYLVIKDGKIAPDNMPVWIYRKDIKDVGRPDVRVPMEYDGLAGWQRKLAEAIKLSLELYPRKTLFAAKNYYWEPNDRQRVKQDLINNGQPKVVSAHTIQGWVADVNVDIHLIEGLKKIYNRANINPIPKMGIAVFRRSFVTYWSQNLNYNGRKKMVRGMLTSFTKADTYYRRDFTNPELKQRVKIAPPRQTLRIDEDDFFMATERPIAGSRRNQEALDIDDSLAGPAQADNSERPIIPAQPLPPPRLSESLIVQDQNGNDIDFYESRSRVGRNVEIVEDNANNAIQITQELPAPRQQRASAPLSINKTRKTNAERQKKYVEAQKSDPEKMKAYLEQRKAIDEKKSIKKMLFELNKGIKLWNKTQAATKTKYDLKSNSDGQYVSGKYPEFD